NIVTERVCGSKKWQHANVDVRQIHTGISPASAGIWQPRPIKCANRATTRRWKKSQALRSHVGLFFPNPKSESLVRPSNSPRSGVETGPCESPGRDAGAWSQPSGHGSRLLLSSLFGFSPTSWFGWGAGSLLQSLRLIEKEMNDSAALAAS